MTAEWIAIGLLAFLVLVFVLDVAANRRRVPRPRPVPQKKPEAPEGAAPKAEEKAEPESAPPAEAPEEPAVVEKAPAEVPAVPEPEPEAPQVSVFERIRHGLGKTRASLTGGLADLFSVGKKVDEDLLEEIETTLLMADVGVTATSEIIESLTDKLERNQLKDGEALRKALRDELHGLLADVTKPLEIDSGKKPYVILMVGVNGVGKTTTIGKLTALFQREGKSVMLAAGDTFRAAAVEQLQVWGERNKVPVVAQHTGADSASVIFDAVQSAQSRGVDVVIADTAGRLQNKDNLMSELEKVVRVIKKLDDTAPHEVMLVLDAGTGQNALSQAQVFQQAVGVSGITLTKLDGTAKGGIVFAIARQLQLPIRYIGVGEQVDDLRSFDARTFVDALFDDSPEK
ncbi:signal recognition particle-docking protein FtsY [Marinobacter vulgaris]|uniref:Signal recognition particle receptor FtsY n=1 Tax=Marinobacter vulgaris TaxID=1928331 RepID=A0A2V3ZPI3_9GAMM|nr:signal recognition particle-docking protein FtsY [Marinobacter vulgaris]PXX93272.1 signal recognition particle-docking protein FtsY [Marinobacter vulgaris]TSJ72717.1 signal recognition particle-docking protein FtsY [Marinobacter vulgaris]